MRLFCLVAEQGSFSQVARQTGMPASTLSRRIQLLEDSLQLRLLNRNAHRISLTTSGQHYLECYAHLFRELSDVALSLNEEKLLAEGKISIAAPVNLAQYWLGHQLNLFLQQHPRINLELHLSNRNIDIADGTIDMAFRVGVPNPSDWIARPLFSVEFIFCISSKEAERFQLSHPKELTKHPLVVSRPVSSWQLETKDGSEDYHYQPEGNVRLAVDDLSVANQSVVDGLGIGLLPRQICQPYLDSGALQHILPDWRLTPRQVYMLYRDRKNHPFRLRLLIDHFLAQVGD